MKVTRPQLAMASRRRAIPVANRDYTPPARNGEWKASPLAMANDFTREAS